jgi:hypothetical protein
VGFTDLPPRGIPRPPPKPRRVAMVVAVYALAIGFGVALYTGSLPGLGGQFSTYTKYDGHEYYTDYVSVPEPSFGQNSTAPASLAFENVTFWYWVTGWGVWADTLVHGNGTEANGTTYAFALGNPSMNESHTTTFFSPDGHFGAWWDGGWALLLYVEIPSATGTG